MLGLLAPTFAAVIAALCLSGSLCTLVTTRVRWWPAVLVAFANGPFTIVRESSVGQGVRRIEAITGPEALAALHKAGFKDATHLGGGVLAWARQIDKSLPTY